MVKKECGEKASGEKESVVKRRKRASQKSQSAKSRRKESNHNMPPLLTWMFMIGLRPVTTNAAKVVMDVTA
jgi:hypothetical protein